MKMTKQIALILCLCLSLLALASCGVIIHEDLGAGDAVDKSSGVVWHHASTCYEAVKLEKKQGKLVVKEQEMELYKLPDMDPNEWLATEDKNVIYSEGVTLPTLAEMAPEEMTIYLDSATELKLKTIDKSEVIDALVKAYTEGESAVYPAKTPYATYRVRFASEDYPGIYYVLTYVEYSSDYIYDIDEETSVNYGKYFFYDRFDQKFIPVGDEIHKALGLGEAAAE